MAGRLFSLVISTSFQLSWSKVLLFWAVDGSERTQEVVKANVEHVKDLGIDHDVILAHYRGSRRDWDQEWYKQHVTKSLVGMGFKFHFLQKAYKNDDWEKRYEFVWALDSDIDLSKADLQEFLDMARQIDSSIVGPTFTAKGDQESLVQDGSSRVIRREGHSPRHSSHGHQYSGPNKIQVPNRGCDFRHTDFVELTAPLLKSTALKSILVDCKHCIHEKSDWGLDMMWCKYVSERFGEQGCALVDKTPVVHLDWGLAPVSPEFYTALHAVQAKYGRYWSHHQVLDCKHQEGGLVENIEETVDVAEKKSSKRAKKKTQRLSALEKPRKASQEEVEETEDVSDGETDDDSTEETEDSATSRTNSDQAEENEDTKPEVSKSSKATQEASDEGEEEAEGEEEQDQESDSTIKSNTTSAGSANASTKQTESKSSKATQEASDEGEEEAEGEEEQDQESDSTIKSNTTSASSANASTKQTESKSSSKATQEASDEGEEEAEGEEEQDQESDSTIKSNTTSAGSANASTKQTESKSSSKGTQEASDEGEEEAEGEEEQDQESDSTITNNVTGKGSSPEDSESNQDGSETVDGIFKVKASAPKPRHGLKDVLDEHPQRAPGLPTHVLDGKLAVLSSIDAQGHVAAAPESSRAQLEDSFKEAELQLRNDIEHLAELEEELELSRSQGHKTEAEVVESSRKQRKKRRTKSHHAKIQKAVSLIDMEQKLEPAADQDSSSLQIRALAAGARQVALEVADEVQQTVGFRLSSEQLQSTRTAALQSVQAAIAEEVDKQEVDKDKPNANRHLAHKIRELEAQVAWDQKRMEEEMEEELDLEGELEHLEGELRARRAVKEPKNHVQAGKVQKSHHEATGPKKQNQQR